MATDVVIVEAVRTAMGRRNGMLSGTHPVSLGAQVLREVVRRAGIDGGMVGDVVFGNVSQVGEQAANIGRNVVLEAGFPYTVPGTTVDRQCGSSQQAIHFAANLISSGVCRHRDWRRRRGHVARADGLELQGRRLPLHPAHARGVRPDVPGRLGRDNIARKWGICARGHSTVRAAAARSAAKAARDAGKFEQRNHAGRSRARGRQGRLQER